MSKALDDITKNISVPTIIQGVSISKPEVALLLTFLYGGIITIAGLWKQRRAQEVVDNLGIETIKRLIERDDKTRDVFHKLLDSVMDEPLVNKRKLFYNYMNNLDKNVHSEFDEHTNIASILSDMTLEEFDILLKIDANFNDIVHKTGQTDKTYEIQNGLNTSTFIKFSSFDNYNQRELEAILVTIATKYRLIFVGFGQYNGNTFGPVNKIGRIFLDFIATAPK